MYRHQSGLAVLGGLLATLSMLLLAHLAGASPPPPPLRSEAGFLPRPQGVSVGGDLLGEPVNPATAGNCSAATAVSCGSVFTWAQNLGNQWSSYPCLYPGVFASLPAQEALFSLAITATDLDVSLSVPEIVTGMQDLFYANLTACDNDTCVASGWVKDGSNAGDAILQEPATGTYRLVIDSPDMDGFGRAIVACGSHATGWCDAVVSDTLACDTYSFTGTTDGGTDNVLDYNNRYAWDGPEVVYRLTLTDTRFLSLTLHYAGNTLRDFNRYMTFFVLDSDCDQRHCEFGGGFAGETGPTRTSAAGLVVSGTYYVVVDGYWMPDRGDAFSMDVGCLPPWEILLPVVLRDR